MRNYREVRIPVGREQEFERFVQNIGGVARRNSLEEEAVWQRELYKARELLLRLDNPDALERLRNRAHALIEELLVPARPGVDYGFHIFSILSNSLPKEDNIPEGVHVKRTPTGAITFGHHSGFLPRDIISFIEAGGFVDGMRKTYKEIASMHGLPERQVGSYVRGVHHRLWNYSPFKESYDEYRDKWHKEYSDRYKTI